MSMEDLQDNRTPQDGYSDLECKT